MVRKILLAIWFVSLFSVVSWISLGESGREEKYNNYILPNPVFQQVWLPHVQPSCDVQQALEATGVDPSNFDRANSSGTSNGIQIWLKKPQWVKFPNNAKRLHVSDNDLINAFLRPGDQIANVSVFTLYWHESCSAK